eukprot:779618-Amphidinium_carterae.1
MYEKHGGFDIHSDSSNASFVDAKCDADVTCGNLEPSETYIVHRHRLWSESGGTIGKPRQKLTESTLRQQASPRNLKAQAWGKSFEHCAALRRVNVRGQHSAVSGHQGAVTGTLM